LSRPDLVDVTSRMRRRALAAAIGAAALLLVCSVAIAGSALPQPKAGAWKFKDADGGFTLAAGKGHKLFLTNIHSRTQNFVGCPEKSEPITVSGRFPLKAIELQGSYPVWGVGKRPERRIATAIATRAWSRSRRRSEWATSRPPATHQDGLLLRGLSGIADALGTSLSSLARLASALDSGERA
jgi:hypothetical protein